MKFGWTHENEILSGRLAMMSFVIMCIVYLKTGQLIPSIW